MDDSVQVRCTRCKSVFRERARRLQNGYSRQCPTCEVVLFFDEDFPNADIKRAMRTARAIRNQLREEEAAHVVAAPSSPSPRGGGGRSRVSGREGD
jgi:NAD-dependent SIR2 family protein deacetylase